MCSRGFKRLYRIDLGRTRYKDTWALQKKLVELRYQNRIPDTLILTEHEPVITMGRATASENLLCSRRELEERNIDLFEVERGGDITYHGPGQLVAYPIVDLNSRGRDIRQYLRDLESLVIAALGDLGIDAGVKKNLTGVWVGDKKLAAIGVAVSRWITYHGLALNVNTDLDYFRLINPCGITEYPVGSISQLLGREQELGAVMNLISDNFARMFYYEMEKVEDINSLIIEGASV